MLGIFALSSPQIYCFSPETGIKLENPLTGCQCPSVCKQSQEEISLPRVFPHLLPFPSPVGIHPSEKKSPPVFTLKRDRESVESNPLSTNPLLYVRLLF